MEHLKLIYSIICLIWFVIFFYALYYLYIKNVKPYKPAFSDLMYSQIPHKYAPLELSLLMYNRVVPSTLPASVIYLFEKGILEFNNDNGVEYIVRNFNYTNQLTPAEDYTIKLLVDIIGDKNRVSIEQLDEFCSHKSNCDIFLLEYQIWCKIMRKEYASTRFFEPKLQYSSIEKIMISGCIIFIVNFLKVFNSYLGYLTLVPALFIMFFFIKTYKRTRESNEEYYKWIAFKNYMNVTDLASLNIDNMDDYIMYGTVLGVDDIEEKLTNHDYFKRITAALNKCVIKSILNGNRKLF